MDIFGKTIDYKGYLRRSLFDRLLQKSVHLITKVKKNIKKHIMGPKGKILPRKWATIETGNKELKNVC